MINYTFQKVVEIATKYTINKYLVLETLEF